jgi:hypothetical protein
MNFSISKKTFPLPPFSEKEILRYAGVCKNLDIDKSVLYECISESEPLIRPTVCFKTFPVKALNNTVRMDSLTIPSKDLAKNLKDAREVILFAATIGIGIDRTIQKYNRLSPTKALYFQAIGSERVEALCDTFCDFIGETKKTLPRFSPGYGDVSLSIQKDVFRLLDCEKNLGLSLSDSLLITPSKSVTAFMGIL